MEKETKTIADMALEGMPEDASVSVVVEETVKEVAPKKPNKYRAGMYRSDKYFRVIKKITYEHTRDANGNIQRTTGTWTKGSNMIIFQKGVETRLTDEDLALPVIQSLIDRKVIYRVG